MILTALALIYVLSGVALCLMMEASPLGYEDPQKGFCLGEPEDCAMDWTPGDLAIKLPRSVYAHMDAPSRHKSGKQPFQTGGVYIVTDVVCCCDEIGLVFSGISSGHPLKGAWHSAMFAKVPPHEADEFDREVIDLLNRQPVEV